MHCFSNTEIKSGLMSQTIEYGKSQFRTALTWLLYPICVLLPMACLVHISDPEQVGDLLPFAFIGLVGSGLAEWIHPHAIKWRQSHSDVITDIAHASLSLVLSTLLRALLIYVFFRVITLPQASFAIVQWPSDWPLGLQLLLALMVAEFGTYWRHRCFHEWPFGWRFHSVHHSSQRLYFLNATRFHFVDLCLAGLSSAIPLALLGATQEVVVLVAIFTGIHGNWQHANVRYKLGWLNWVIASAELHRWHHSSLIRHTNSNYGNNLIIWDVVFGTRCLPGKPQVIEEIGLGEHQAFFPQTWRRHLLVPLRWPEITADVSSNAQAEHKQQTESA